jgi:hypothetical protein
MVGFVFVNNLVAVAFWYLEGAQHGAMGGIQQGLISCSVRPSIRSNVSNGMQVFLIVRE